ncbi:putative transcriptional regulators containing the CopG/Arc/MetJ DNA-binding domain and a metal-binding domain [Thermoplasmatales archaeon BRNA1]|nr:putative transcriptional regulators containing the CopG/Arc/MetJ DNA-binding domain and a metal-binding domain [Thermoplasmatales archaeon BRNA1]
MAVISVSLGEDNIEDLDRIQKLYGLKGRSDAVRTAINLATSEVQDLKELEGSVEGVLITIRHDHADPWMSTIQARYVNAIKTQLHSHLKDKKCLEVMIVSCSADDLRSMMFEIEGTGKADYVRFVRS